MKTIDSGLKELVEGNLRFMSGKTAVTNIVDVRKELTEEQHPFAVIVGCSDSRVSPELIFDATLGDLFVIRTAGNIVDSIGIGSIEYAVEHLKVPLVIVLGHEKCGAVTAAVNDSEEEGDIAYLVEEIQNNIKLSENDYDVDSAVRANAIAVAKFLTATSELLAHAVEAKELRVLAARYDLDSGRVSLLN